MATSQVGSQPQTSWRARRAMSRLLRTLRHIHNEQVRAWEHFARVKAPQARAGEPGRRDRAA